MDNPFLTPHRRLQLATGETAATLARLREELDGLADDSARRSIVEAEIAYVEQHQARSR